MAAFLSSQFFAYFVVPLGTVALSIFVKKVSQNDRYATLAKEDFAVGLEISLAALITFVGYSVSLARRLSNTSSMSPTDVANLQDRFMVTPWILLGFVFGLWGMSTVVRKWGWTSKEKMTGVWGVGVPFAWGLISLVFVVAWIGD